MCKGSIIFSAYSKWNYKKDIQHKVLILQIAIFTDAFRIEKQIANENENFSVLLLIIYTMLNFYSNMEMVKFKKSNESLLFMFKMKIGFFLKLQFFNAQKITITLHIFILKFKFDWHVWISWFGNKINKDKWYKIGNFSFIFEYSYQIQTFVSGRSSRLKITIRS